MSRSPWYLALGLVVLLLWSGWLTSRASSRADKAEGRVAVLDSLRLEAEGRAQADSVALEAERAGAAEREAELAAARAESSRRASRASQSADSARIALRAALDALGAPTVDLDRLELAHAAQVRALEDQIAQADSVGAVRLSLLEATERALGAERDVRHAAMAEVTALRDQVSALRSVQRRKGIELWATRGAVVLVALATLR